MNLISDVLNLANAAAKSNIDAVLATVVHTEGSAYRKPGAMMLICADGRTVGMISGGCLEPHIIKRAFWLTRQGATIQVYQTGDESQPQAEDASSDIEDDELEMNFGLGCHGRVHVLFERLDTAQPFLNIVSKVRATNEPCRVATLIHTEDKQLKIGTRFSLAQDTQDSERGERMALSCHAEVLSNISVQNLAHFYENYRDYLVSYSLMPKRTAYVPITIGALDKPKQTQWFIQDIQPQIKLLICGAGNDVVPLVKLAKMQDWHVTVIDSRPQYATLSRFRDADVVKQVPLDDTATLIDLSKNAAVAIMSHSLKQDCERLKTLLAHPPLYLGQLGPTYRTERLLDEVLAASRDAAIYEQGIQQLHYPIGLKLGGDGPEALALSIMAQISAVIYDKERDLVEACLSDKNRGGALSTITNSDVSQDSHLEAFRSI